MANTTIRLRKSGVTSNVPVSLELGELALNYADGKLYYKNALGVITYISSGASTNSFATINSNSSLIIATSNTDILSLAGSNNITINTDTINKVITIGARLTDSLFINSSSIGASANATAQLNQLVITAQGIASYTANQVSYLDGYSNAAFAQANSATSLAQSAYNYANTITGGGTTTFFNYLTVQKQLYTANASQTNFFVNYTAPYVTVVVNGATIDSSEYSTATANTIILNNPASVGDVVDIIGFYQANSATITAGGGAGTDQWVRDTANSAVANTIVTQGVDAWQNTQITAVNGYATSAHNTANGANGMAVGAYNAANGANGLAGGAYNKANNALPLTGGTITGSIIVNQNVTVTGNLYVAGNTTTIGTQDLILDDSLIYLANNNPANLVDIGIVGNFTTDHYQHTGIVRNHLNSNWIFFSNVSSEPTTTVNFAEANLVYDSITVGGIITPTATINGKDWQSVATTQNNNITYVNQFTQSAYNQSNVTIGVDATQNTQIQGIQGVDDTQNTRIQSIETINTNQNTEIIIIQGTNTWQNSQITYVNQFTQSAYNKANNALANATGTFAGDLTTTGNVIINGGQSSFSTGSGSLRVSGGLGVGGNVYADKIYVNGLFWAANGNVISTGSGTSSVNQFGIYKYIATAGQTTFSGADSASQTLSYTAGAIIVTLNGLTLKPGTDFTATDGSQIVLDVAADLSDELNIYAFTATVVSTNTLTTYKYIANASQTLIAGNDVSGNPLLYTRNGVFVTYNGVVLKDTTDYAAISGNTVTLTFNANANDEINIYSFNSIGIANTYTIQQSDAKFTTAGKSLAINFFRS